MSKTICIDPEATVYGTMGAYGVSQKQEDYILARKMEVIRACYMGYTTPDMAASQIFRLQAERPTSMVDGERMNKAFADGMADMSKAFNEFARQARDTGVNDE